VNQRPTLLKSVSPASLADEEDFQLGEIWVRPSLREIEAGGTRESLEPRVMQVLVLASNRPDHCAIQFQEERKKIFPKFRKHRARLPPKKSFCEKRLAR